MAGADGLTAADAILDRAGRLFAGEKRRFAVALSGGADSAVAAWVAVQAVGAARVRAIHVHHGREASEDLARAASEIAAVLDIAFTQVGVEVPAGPSFEAQARSVRLPALEAAAAAGEEIVTGHHRGDAAETVLGNLIRGAGAAGLSGISARRGRWMRPLLSIPRAEVKAAAAELGLPFVDDPTNTDRSLTRNLLRLDVLPELEQRLGPGVESSLARAAGLLAADDEELDRLASCVRVVAEDDAVTAPARSSWLLLQLRSRRGSPAACCGPPIRRTRERAAMYRPCSRLPEAKPPGFSSAPGCSRFARGRSSSCIATNRSLPPSKCWFPAPR